MRRRPRGRWVDDWFRPVAADGSLRRPREVSPRDRTLMLVVVLVALLVLVGLLLSVGTGRALALSGGLLGVAAVQLVSLCRTRSVGFSVRR